MSKHKDKIPGGLADKKQPSDFDQNALAAGIKVELEHTSDKTIATEIAMDHLTEDKDYYKKLKEVEKYDRVDREADGKQELDYGKEELDKDKKKKTIKDRWNSLKKTLKNEEAFYSLEDAIDEEDEDQAPPEGGAEQEDVDAAQTDEGETEDSSEEGDDQIPEWLPEGIAIEGQDASPSGDMPEEGGNEESGEEGQGDEDLEEMLREAGHSDAEIAHILHGHMVPQQDEAKRAKAEAEYAGIDRDHEAHQKEMQLRDQEAEIENEHAKRMKDVEYQRAQKESGLSDVEVEHAKRMKDLEYQQAQAEAQVNEAKLKADHAKRMLDLEYEVAKQQKQLELEYKKKEMDMKLKHADELAQQKHKDKLSQVKEDAKTKAQEKKKAASKLKKNDDLIKAVNWSFNPKTQQFNHPEHGSILVKPSDTGGFHMIHNGKTISHHEGKEGLKSGLQEYIKNYNAPIKVSASAAKHTGVTTQHSQPAAAAVNTSPKPVAAAPKATATSGPMKDNPATSWTAGGTGRRYAQIGGEGIGEDKE